MPNLKTTEETTLTSMTGFEYQRLATAGANWKTTLQSMFEQVGYKTGFSSGIIVRMFSGMKIGDAGNTFKVSQWIETPLSNAGDFLYPTFSSLMAMYNTMRINNADNSYSAGSIPGSPGTDAKTTMTTSWLEFTARAAGQRFIDIQKLHAYGMGDAFFQSRIGDFSSGPVPGDEGVGFSANDRMEQRSSPFTGIITSVTRALGNTTLAQNVNANFGTQTVQVVDTTGINVNDWYTIERMKPSAAYNAEAVKITAVDHTANTITAVFRNNHFTGATVTPALVLNAAFGGETGQLRVVVNRSGTTYTTGNVSGSGGASLFGAGGANWSTGMVGGDSINIGAISLETDDYVAGNLRSWYEIASVPAPTNVSICSYSVAADISYRSSRAVFPTNYRINPAVRMLFYDSSTGVMVCETTTTTWSIGDTVELAVCPYPDVRGYGFSMAAYTAGATFRTLFSLTNSGPVPSTGAIAIGGLSAGTDQGYSFLTGINLGNSKTGINIVTPNVSGAVGISLSGSVGTTGINWVSTSVGIDRNAFNGLKFGTLDSSNYFESFGPSQGINTDANLALSYFFHQWIQLVGITNVKHPYIKLDAAAIAADGTTAVQIPTGDYGLNLIGPTVDAHSRYSSFHSYGMGTNGVFATARQDVTLANGDNGTVTIDPPASFIRIIGPTAVFSIAGITQTFGSWGGGSPASDGTFLTIYNSTGFAMTIRNDGGGGAGFLTLTGGDVTLRAGPSAATFKYVGSGGDARWILISTN